ncbi:MAG: cupin domain-containing protein [Desulfobacterales bacterium]
MEEFAMPTVFNLLELELKSRKSPLPEFSWKTSPRLAKLVNAEDFEFDIRSLDPDRFSFPYHFHRNAEELFFIISGKSMLRTPDGFTEVNKNEVIFFEKGPAGAHQLYNHSDSECVYLDIRTTAGVDICEYPDSGKINILPYLEVYESSAKVDYYKGEDKVKMKWPDEIVNQR